MTDANQGNEKTPLQQRASYWLNRLLAWWHQWPSWRIIYRDGKRSWPLRHGDAVTRRAMFDGLRVEYCRDHNGNFLP